MCAKFLNLKIKKNLTIYINYNTINLMFRHFDSIWTKNIKEMHTATMITVWKFDKSIDIDYFGTCVRLRHLIEKLSKCFYGCRIIKWILNLARNQWKKYFIDFHAFRFDNFLITERGKTFKLDFKVSVDCHINFWLKETRKKSTLI